MQGNVLRECGTSLRAIIANSSMPIGTVESYVADLLLDGSVLDISHVYGKNNTLTKHIRHMRSTRVKCDMFKIIYFKFFVYWVWGVLQLIQGGINFPFGMSLLNIMFETDCCQINVWSKKYVEIQMNVKSLFLTTEKLPWSI